MTTARSASPDCTSWITFSGLPCQQFETNSRELFHKGGDHVGQHVSRVRVLRRDEKVAGALVLKVLTHTPDVLGVLERAFAKRTIPLPGGVSPRMRLRFLWNIATPSSVSSI